MQPYIFDCLNHVYSRSLTPSRFRIIKVCVIFLFMHSSISERCENNIINFCLYLDFLTFPSFKFDKNVNFFFLSFSRCFYLILLPLSWSFWLFFLTLFAFFSLLASLVLSCFVWRSVFIILCVYLSRRLSLNYSENVNIKIFSSDYLQGIVQTCHRLLLSPPINHGDAFSSLRLDLLRREKKK